MALIDTRHRAALGRHARLRAALVAVLLAAGFAAPASAGKVSISGAPDAANNCERCHVQMTFAAKMRDLGAEIEFVELRNGIGVFYTAADVRLVPKVQSANDWARNELTRLSTAEAATLCQYCKASRPVFSRIDREVVRTDTGALFLMRSKDPEAVRALHEMRRIAETRTRNNKTPAPSR